jgi:methionyl-tRNA synthetase
LDCYAANPGFIRPDSRKNETVKFVEGGLKDLSVSRTSFDWGVKVPGSENHVMYVWLDALTTYISAIGFPNDTEEWRKFWPASIHIIGKDIVRFHTVYWPAFLMSAGLPLPKMVFGHGFLLSRGEKMSKSLGNVVDPMELAELFGVDALRYFLLREVSFGQDGSYSPEAIVTRVNADLANSFGNLAQRTLSLIFKNCEGYLPAINGHHSDDQALLELVGNVVSMQIPGHCEELAMSQALEAWMQAVFACNAYVDVQAPWALKKTDPERMETVLATLFICIAQLAIAVQPIIPGSATKLLDQMGVPQDVRNYARAGSHWYSPLAEGGFQIAQPTGLFPRLELPAEEGASV